MAIASKKKRAYSSGELHATHGTPRAALRRLEISMKRLLVEHRAMTKAWYKAFGDRLAEDIRTGKRYPSPDPDAPCNSEPI